MASKGFVMAVARVAARMPEEKLMATEERGVLSRRANVETLRGVVYSRSVLSWCLSCS